MTLAKLPYGTEVSNTIYAVFQTWITQTQVEDLSKQTKEGKECCSCVGFLTVAGKSLAVAPAHLLTAVVVCPALFIYDLVMSLFFLLANLCTAFAFDFLRERLATHAYSAVQLPLQCARHFFSALCPPVAYRAEGVLQQRSITNTGEVEIEGGGRDKIPRGIIGYAYQEILEKARSPEGERELAHKYRRELGNPDDLLSEQMFNEFAPYVYKG